jgi:hypothetical protein
LIHFKFCTPSSSEDREWESEVIEIDTDITVPGTSKKTNRTVSDRLIKKTSHEDFVVVWRESVFDKCLTFEGVTSISGRLYWS